MNLPKAKNRETVINEGIEISGVNGENVSQNLALLAHTTNRVKKNTVNVVKNGERFVMEAIESPFHVEDSLDKICTAGALIDISELDELKRNLKLHQNAQLEILGTLGTAFAVFNQQFKLAFYNQSFARLWELDNLWLEQQPNYSMFLDVIREKRLLPEVPDYMLFKTKNKRNFQKSSNPKKICCICPTERLFGGCGLRIRWAA